MKRAAVIGLGDISKIHLAAIAADPQIELAAVCDANPAARENAPADVPFFTDYRELARTVQPDCVHICLPHFLHFPVSCYFAERGIHVLCEKPVAMNTAQARAFTAFEAAHPAVHIGVSLQNRMNETVETLKELIGSGAYGGVRAVKGVVLWARSKAYYEAKRWRGAWQTAGGGCMINQSVHTLDLLYYLGGPIESLRAGVAQLLDYGIEVEDTAAARLAYKNGAHGLFLATNANYKNESVQLSVQLEKAEFVIENNVLYRASEDGARERLCEDARMPGTKFYYGASHKKLISRFYRSLEAGTEDYIHVRDAEMSIRLIDAVQKAGRTGETISFDSAKEGMIE